ncbi:MAG: translation initiation factor IF-2 [Christensenellales bacterium]
MKIHELAKELGVASKEIIEKAQKLGLKITSHLSNIDEEQANQIRKQYSNKAEKNTGKTTEGENNKKEKKEKSSPVIIRREVILSDDEEEKKEEKKDNRRKDVGFVERRNKDYNIVYRNKTVKPLTVNELFGLGKKEEKKEEKKEIKKEEKKETTIKEDSEKIMPKVEEKKEETVVTANKTASDTKPAVEPEVNKPRFHNNNNNNRNYNPNYNRRENSNNNYNNRGYNRNNQQNRNNNNFNRNNNQNSNGNNNGYNNNGYNRNNNFNRNNNQNNFGNRPTNGFNKGQRPLDNRRIDKNIKDIMETEIVEKENQRDYSSRAIDKEKSNRYDDNKNKKAPKSRRFNENDEYDEGKLKNLKQVDKLSSMFEDQEGGMLDYYDLSTERGKRGKRKNLKTTDRVKQKIFKLTEITIPESISVKDLAAELKKTSGEVIKKLLELGIMATINQELDFDTAFLIAQEFGVTANKKATVNEEDILFDESEDRPEDLVQRPPVVVVMGHVDHGKTSLLDAIRKTNVIEGEAGGITQHIGAYKVSINGREITFLDTPGHEAFTSMRARGAQITDVAILVVAADDGVMPQTIEAINHAKAAEIPIVVAINKIDVPGANPEKVKQELMKYDLVPEEWGGDTIFVEISAKQHINIDQLLEMVLLVSDVRDLKVNPKKQAKGVVIEARLDKAKGPIASVLVQRGSLDVGDTIVLGTTIGRIRAMKDDKGKMVKSAGPSTPVEIMGLTKVPEAGDIFYEVKDEKMAKHLIEKRERKEREDAMNLYNKVTLDNLLEKMENEDLKQLNIIVKADVQGTAEALKQALEKLSDNEVAVRVIHSNAGAINESDVNLAKAAKAIIIGFNVRPNANAKSTAEKQGVEIKLYSVIYQALEDVEAAMNGLLDPIYEEKVIGNVEVRQTFKISNVGTIAGGYVKEGKIERNAGVRVIREDIVIHEGKLISLKRFKDDVKEVSKGFECGLQIEGYNDLKEGDIIEVYVMEEKPRTRRRKNEQ